MPAQACSSLPSFDNSETKFSKEPEVSKRRSPVVLVETIRLVVQNYPQKNKKKKHVSMIDNVAKRQASNSYGLSKSHRVNTTMLQYCLSCQDLKNDVDIFRVFRC